ncbi:hypothetical protein ACJX0J_016808, partial [Zea mays]
MTGDLVPIGDLVPPSAKGIHIYSILIYTKNYQMTLIIHHKHQQYINFSINLFPISLVQANKCHNNLYVLFGLLAVAEVAAPASAVAVEEIRA